MGAIANDSQNRLRWSRRGHHLSLDIAKGLVYLHSNQVWLRFNVWDHCPKSLFDCNECFERSDVRRHEQVSPLIASLGSSLWYSH